MLQRLRGKTLTWAVTGAHPNRTGSANSRLEYFLMNVLIGFPFLEAVNIAKSGNLLTVVTGRRKVLNKP